MSINLCAAIVCCCVSEMALYLSCDRSLGEICILFMHRLDFCHHKDAKSIKCKKAKHENPVNLQQCDRINRESPIIAWHYSNKKHRNPSQKSRNETDLVLVIGRSCAAF